MNNGPRSYKRLWIAFAFVMIASFAVLGGYGFRIATPLMQTLRWLRVPGDTLFALGHWLWAGFCLAS